MCVYVYVCMYSCLNVCMYVCRICYLLLMQSFYEVRRYVDDVTWAYEFHVPLIVTYISHVN